MSRIFQIEKEMMAFLKTIPVGVTPGLQIQALQKGQKVLDLRWGETYSYYDLASITKALFTSMAFAYAFDQGKVDLNQKVTFYYPIFPHKEIEVKDLLTHTSGLEAYYPFYEELQPLPQLDSYEILLQKTFQLPLGSWQKSVYSDLGFLVLGRVLEHIFSLSLENIWSLVQNYFYPQVEGLHFCKGNQSLYRKNSYAPTTRCPWRETLIQGEVHDEHAWLLGGVAPHAGLFGSIDDLNWALLTIRAQIIGIGRKVLKQKTSQLFLSRSMPSTQGDWALGFMLPGKVGSSSGQYLSPQSVGHLGFTGVSFWFDPVHDLIISLLSNRVFYGRNNKEFNQWRPLIHDKVVEFIKKY
jgi:serine-type D-Ala-D-Ala carboxypeptidase